MPTGSGIHTKQYGHIQHPLLLGEGWGEGNIRLWWSFRSLYVPCYSVTTLHVNVPGWLTATTLATRAPCKKIATSRIVRPIPGAHPFGASASAVQNCSGQFCPQLIPFGFRVGRDAASMQVAPSRRIPAPRPGLQETLRRFSAGPWSRYQSFISMASCHR